MNILIAGYGEIGKALYEVLHKHYNVDVIDPYQGKEAEITHHGYDLLFIAFPFNNKFESEVYRYKSKIEPAETIIFSTVPIGTCAKLDAVHSPVEGKHPKLAESIKLSIRFFGGNACVKTAILFKNLGIKVRILEKPEFTEFLKMSSTSLYGLNLEFARYRKEVADKLNMPFGHIIEFDEMYNQLYKDLEMPEYSRYILTPPEGNLGGHCVMPNAKLLDKQHPSIFLKEIYKDKEKNGNKKHN